LGAYRPASTPVLLSQEKPYALSVSPSAQYPDDSRKLTDGVIAFTWAAQAGWYNSADAVYLTLDLGAPSSVSRVEVYAMRSDASAVNLPAEVTMALSADGASYGTPVTLTLETNQNESINRFSLDQYNIPYRYVRFACKPGAAWLMLCEVKVYGENLSRVADWALY